MLVIIKTCRHRISD